MHLMNSAIMTTPGTYTVKMLSKEEFSQEIIRNYERIQSHVGYEQALNHIFKLTDKRFGLNRDFTRFEDGDQILVLRLAYRIADPKTKGNIQREDYEYLEVKFRSIPDEVDFFKAIDLLPPVPEDEKA